MTSRRIRQLLCLLLCLAVLAPCAACGETTRVATYLLRLREGPSSTSKVLDAYPRGTRVTILKKGSDWTKVRVYSKEGYMKTNLLSYARGSGSGKVSSAAAATGASSGVSAGVAYVVKGTWLNLREKMGGGAIIGCYRGGTMVTVLKKGRHWSRVEVKGQTGFMANAYLTDTAP